MVAVWRSVEVSRSMAGDRWRWRWNAASSWMWMLTSMLGPWACPRCLSCDWSTNCQGANLGGISGTKQANPWRWLTPIGPQLASCQAPCIALWDAASLLMDVLWAKQARWLQNGEVTKSVHGRALEGSCNATQHILVLRNGKKNVPVPWPTNFTADKLSEEHLDNRFHLVGRNAFHCHFPWDNVVVCAARPPFHWKN